MLESTTEPATEAPAGSIRLEMFGPPPQFRPTSLTAAPGEVVFYLENGSPSGQEHGAHTLAIGTTQGAPIVVGDEVRGGRRAVFTVHGLEAGDYVIWCTLFGHAGLGQEGTLKVG
jgi:plastocyanin